MSDFKNTTRTISGHHNWDGNRVHIPPSFDRIDSNPGHAEVFPSSGGNRIQGNAGVQRGDPPTAELAEHGGRSPLTSGYKKGGSAKHFHVHKHFHAKGGRTHSMSRSYSVAEKSAEKFAEGGHVHDCTEVPAGGPDYARGGKVHIKPKNRGALHRDMGIPKGQKIPKNRIQAKLARDKASGNTKGVKRDVFALNFRGKKPVEKNAGGALYATGGTVNKLAMGGVPMQGTPAVGALGRLAMRPQGMPLRQAPPMRRPMTMPGPQPLMRAEGGPVGMRRVAKQEVAKHVRTPPPRGHGVK